MMVRNNNTTKPTRVALFRKVDRLTRQANLLRQTEPDSKKFSKLLQEVTEGLHEAELIAEALTERAAVEPPVGPDSPVAFVRWYVSLDPKRPRMDVINELVAQGINPSTARTQYHRWIKAYRSKAAKS